MLLFLHDFIMNMFVLWFFFLYISRHSLTSFVHCAENSKKKKILPIQFVVSLHFGMIEIIFMFTFFTHICVKGCVLNRCDVFWYLGWSYGSILLFHDLPKRGSTKILARSSISSESQIKVNFKVTASQ